MYTRCSPHRVFWLFPVSKASESLDYLDGFPILRKGTKSKLVSKFLTWLERLGLEEFTTSHDQNREEEWRLGANVIGGVQRRVKEVNEGVESQEHEVEQNFGVGFIQNSSGYRVLQAGLYGRVSGLRRSC